MSNLLGIGGVGITPRAPEDDYSAAAPANWHDARESVARPGWHPDMQP
ncbi:hypothetical protein [uncultured Ruegeria sp.]|nr:hypothetical protein [uncultured Ruegeria sp.]